MELGLIPADPFMRGVSSMEKLWLTILTSSTILEAIFRKMNKCFKLLVEYLRKSYL